MLKNVIRIDEAETENIIQEAEFWNNNKRLELSFKKFEDFEIDFIIELILFLTCLEKLKHIEILPIIWGDGYLIKEKSGHEELFIINESSLINLNDNRKILRLMTCEFKSIQSKYQIEQNTRKIENMLNNKDHCSFKYTGFNKLNEAYNCLKKNKHNDVRTHQLDYLIKYNKDSDQKIVLKTDIKDDIQKKYGNNCILDSITRDVLNIIDNIESEKRGEDKSGKNDFDYAIIGSIINDNGKSLEKEIWWQNATTFENIWAIYINIDNSNYWNILNWVKREFKKYGI